LTRFGNHVATHLFRSGAGKLESDIEEVKTGQIAAARSIPYLTVISLIGDYPSTKVKSYFFVFLMFILAPLSKDLAFCRTNRYPRCPHAITFEKETESGHQSIES
jgi:hypothetical protein